MILRAMSEMCNSAGYIFTLYKCPFRDMHFWPNKTKRPFEENVYLSDFSSTAHLNISQSNSQEGVTDPHHLPGRTAHSGSCIKERLNQTRTKPNCNSFNNREHSSASWCSCSCLHPIRTKIIALHNTCWIWFALSFLYLLELIHF